MALVIVKKSSYEYNILREDVFEILERLEAGGSTIGRGSRVLIKPNLLTASTQEQAITTHPLVVRAAVEYVLSKGARPLVSDSPPIGPFHKIARKCGIDEALSGLQVEIRELGPSREVKVEGRWRHLELSGDALDADLIINLPKLKTHVQMGLTLAVKNLFGCIVGMKKPEWHFRIGENKEIFAELLLTVCRTLAPSMNLIDGILAMEGDGPGTGGTPRQLEVLLGSTSPTALDMVTCRMLGIEPSSIPTIKSTASDANIDEIEVLGDLPKVKNFIVPETKEMLFGPSYAHGFLRRHLTTRPESMEDICRLCSECVKICPASAITTPEGKGSGKRRKALKFDYDKCIRCYCCLEICPHAAIRKRDTFIKKIMDRLNGLRRKMEGCNH